jgi:glycine dehydrogenase subunit 1
MLAAIGVANIDELFESIPEAVRLKELDLPKGVSEVEVLRRFQELAGRNASGLTSFLGGGFYDHFIPAAVDSLSSRGEFFTAYTPYQPEASQGTLQAIFEYQSAICRLTKMDVANASLYDGGTALVEAAMMAIRVTGRDRIMVDAGVNPIYRRLLHSHLANLNVEIVEVETAEGKASRAALEAELTDETAALLLQNPNFFGSVDDFSDLAEKASAKKILVCLSVYPLALGLLKAPGEMGADIVTGEGQSLGLPLGFGGPYLGFMATRMQHVRKMPGRLAGETVDRLGRVGYVLTLQAREQHIRREKATSNVCSNTALCALRAVIYMTLLGKQGLREVAESCAHKTAYAKRKLTEVAGVSLKFAAPSFNEFVLELPKPAKVVAASLLERGVAGGFPLGRYYDGMENSLLVAVTEKHTTEDIEKFVKALEAVL